MSERQEDLFWVDEEIPCWQVARALGWDARKTRRAMIAAEIAHRLPGSSEWHVSRSDLVRLMPQVEATLRDLRERGMLGQPGRARPGNRNRAKTAR